MAIMSWNSLAGGKLLSSAQRAALENEGIASIRQKNLSARDISISNTLESLASHYRVSVQAIAIAYLLAQSPYVVPIVGVQTAAHVRALPDALTIQLKRDDIKKIHDASPFDPLFPMNFLFNFRGDQPYHTFLTEKDSQQYQMASLLGGPPKQQPY